MTEEDLRRGKGGEQELDLIVGLGAVVALGMILFVYGVRRSLAGLERDLYKAEENLRRRHTQCPLCNCIIVGDAPICGTCLRELLHPLDEAA